MRRALLPTLALSLSLAGAPTALQGPAPGHRLYGPHGTTNTFLVDTNGSIVHTWPGDDVPGNGIYLEPDGTLIRAGRVNGHPGPGGAGGSIQRIAFDGTILWDYQYTGPNHWSHHDFALLPNGNILLIAWDILTAADAVAAGRNPALLNGSTWLPDTIVEVRQTGLTTGEVVWKWSVMDHVIQDHDPTKANFGVVADHPELLDINFPPEVSNNGDWNHANSISYMPENDLILINFPFQDELYLIDHSTTTAEAAGHTGGNYGKGGDFLYRWGRPEAYGAGTAADRKLYNPHGTAFILAGLPGAGNVIGFNNQAGHAVGQNFSAVYELELPADFSLAPGAAFGPSDFVWEYTAPTPTDFYSSGLSNAERLPNGNTLVCSGRQSGWLFEVTSAKQKVWEYFNSIPNPNALVFQVSYYERTLWADVQELSVAPGGSVDFDLVAGSPYSGDFYVLLGSLSGTSPGLAVDGHVLPLQPDAYFQFTLENPGAPPLSGNVGLLDGLGRATVGFDLPAGAAAALVGATAHHAFAAIDSIGGAVALTSNAVPLAFVP